MRFEPKTLGLDPLMPPYVPGRPEIGANPIAELDGKILLNHKTGRIVFAAEKGPVISNQVKALWLVRHGETAVNAMAGFQGQVNGPENQLTEKGKAQAEETARKMVEQFKEKIANNEEVVVVVSAMKRAGDTADIFIKKFREAGGKIKEIKESEEMDNAEISKINEIRSGLLEMDYGVWDNVDLATLSAEEKTKLDRYRDGLDATVSPEAGESYIDLLVRVKDWLQKLNGNDAYKGKTVVLFGHATQMGAIRVLMGDMAMNDATGQINWRQNRLQNAAPFNVVEAIQQAPRSEARAKEWERELGIGPEAFSEAAKKWPLLAGFAPARVREDWQRELGIGKEALAAVILKNPQLAGRNPANVRDNWEKELGIGKNELVTAILKYPSLVNLA